MTLLRYMIAEETPSDYLTTETLTREAFWNVYRPGCVEHFLLRRFRTLEEFVPELSLCLRLEDGRIVAHVMYARAEIALDSGGTLPIGTFGPISVAPEFKRQGYGTALLRESLERARKFGFGALAITGDIGFYGKSGFVVASTKNVYYYAEPRENVVPYFLIRELRDGFLNGVKGTFREPSGYDVEGVDIDAFDAEFPPKIKMKLPGQIFG